MMDILGHLLTHGYLGGSLGIPGGWVMGKYGYTGAFVDTWVPWGLLGIQGGKN
jgi:hypothetical protein